MRFQCRGGRKRIVAPDGSELMPAAKPQPYSTLVKALARAWRWQRMLDDGVYASVSEVGDAENISKSYVSRILRLALLSPDLIEAILAGRTDQALVLGRLEQPLPASWEEQRRRLQLWPQREPSNASVVGATGVCGTPRASRLEFKPAKGRTGQWISRIGASGTRSWP
jgi:hypothetical protein